MRYGEQQIRVDQVSGDGRAKEKWHRGGPKHEGIHSPRKRIHRSDRKRLGWVDKERMDPGKGQKDEPHLEKVADGSITTQSQFVVAIVILGVDISNTSAFHESLFFLQSMKIQLASRLKRQEAEEVQSEVQAGTLDGTLQL